MNLSFINDLFAVLYSGAPPHGGIAFGVYRLLMILTELHLRPDWKEEKKE
ncbi:tRNA synthetases class II (D, K and N) [Candidatus Electrothrix aarhusensis]|uniref:tRNA synthetases class II (D, K and N) n=1 Tax=Candidatus Electrothrix aarhusensis TaxID=1859131 RepID=A0A3S3RSM0_9BACT|nr:tRNA synthetases class II (D, K and N) [Candidatus Electrothrix aarhusensis]